MTGTDLEKPVAINPATGEVVDLTLGTDTLARARREVIDTKDALDVFAKELDGEMTARLDRENMRSAVVDDGDGERRWEIKATAPTSEVWPLGDLAAALDLLVEAGKITAAVKDSVLVPQPPVPQLPKLAKAELNKLLKHMDPEVRDTLAAVKVIEPKLSRPVTVKELPPLQIPARAAA